ncbi:hypothetical protein DPSP01_011419 [Paraphaeosphaeria sporulosa]|uniref:Uncharacterized protein n=1 Tax=Paraphaeosphaeria sporulosa TaxID=1460663 RepID=A0A177CHF8_9PLEO|nr:uncharacterized protein CC84DRAFT_1196369 [Paraphaeosphaeria sporulosa]OAG06278.1 hypothetical protein CC84DRAFT_1196369 [Paraphaeosphaeria sporulosa]
MSGRGGAGNIMRAQEQSKKSVEDVEAQRTPTTASPPPTSSASSTNAQAYAHTGRGGAGNWYEPSKLAKDGTFSSPSSADATAPPTNNARPNVSTPWHPEGQEMPVGRAGRGGAGNFVWKDEDEEERRRVEEERKRGEVSQSVERDVEAGLAKPPGVLLGGVKAGRGW